MTAAQDQPNTVATRTRGRHGQFDRDPHTVARDAEATRLRARSWSYQQIADHFGITRSSAFDAVQRVLKETIQEPAAELRKLELERLDAMAQEVLLVLARRHVTVSNGKVIRQFVGYEVDENGVARLDGEGKPIPKFEDLEDDAPVLAAVDRLLRIQERRARLLGLDIPVKQEIAVDLGVEYRIVGVDVGQLR